MLPQMAPMAPSVITVQAVDSGPFYSLGQALFLGCCNMSSTAATDCLRLLLEEASTSYRQPQAAPECGGTDSDM